MPKLIRIALLSALCLPMFGGTAEAAPPTKFTLYTDSSVDADISGTIKIKIGSSTNKIKKLTLVANCDTGPEKLVVKDIEFKSSDSFYYNAGPTKSFTGTWKNKNKVTGNFRTDLCGFFGGEYTAKS